MTKKWKEPRGCPRCGGAWVRSGRHPRGNPTDPVDDEDRITPATGRARDLKFEE